MVVILRGKVIQLQEVDMIKNLLNHYLKEMTPNMYFFFLILIEIRRTNRKSMSYSFHRILQKGSFLTQKRTLSYRKGEFEERQLLI